MDVVWLVVWAVASSFWCLTAATRLGATFDEPIYLEQGLEVWRTGSHAGLLRLGTMPLPIDIQTFPLFLYEKYTNTPIDPVADCDRLLPYARAGTLLFWWVLLTYGLLAGRRLAGPWGGRAVVAVLACEPNFLAHAALATTDVAVTAALLAFVYHFQSGRDAGWWRRVALPAVWFAAAVLAKASGLVFGPLAILAVEGGRVILRQRERGQGWRTWWAAFADFRRDALQIGLLGLVLTFVYCGSDWKAQASWVRWAQTLPEGTPRDGMVWVAENLRIFSNAGDGLVRQVRHNVRGHGVYLLGEVHPRALWYYFPVALSVKLPLFLLLLPLTILIIRPRALLNWACLAAAALLIFSLTCRVQIGIRLVLPLVALAAVGIAAAAVETWSQRRHWMPAGLLGGGVLWMTVSAVLVWPHGLCYANEAWGGSRQAYRRLSDSNFDWGQGLKDLAKWQRAQGVAQLDVWYFGTDPHLKSLPMRPVPLHAVEVASAEELRGLLRGRYLAASTTLVHGMPSRISDAHNRAAALLREQVPVAQAATFLIYDFGDQQALAP